MSKEKTLTAESMPAQSGRNNGGSSMLSELFHAGLYKPSQGKIVRQLTFLAIMAFILLACYRLMVWLESSAWSEARFALPVALAALGGWITYRAVNVPRFADFLIAVQAEMNKVSWPSKQELIRSSIVVLFVIFFLAGILFGFDLVWMWLFKAIGIIRA